MIYVIGDSHSSIFCGKDHIQPQWGYCYTLTDGILRKNSNKFIKKNIHFCSIRSGPHIAYNLITKYHLFDEIIREYSVGKSDYIFFSFGEIDIRHHLLVNKGKRTLQKVIEDCVDRYIEFLLHYKNKGLRVGVWGPIPSLNKLNYITRDFNTYLENKCKSNNIIYKSIHKKLLNDAGLIIKKMYMKDEIHALYSKCKHLIDEEFRELYD